MSITGTTVTGDFSGDGATLNFTIPFTFFDNTQVKVKSLDTTTDVETVLTVGTHYTISGGDPGTVVEFITAPDTDEVITIYRVTPRTQTTSYLATAAFPIVSHENTLDRIVMMIQELDEGIVSATVPGGGQFTREANQSVTSGGIITVGSNQRETKRVQGSGGAVTCDTTTPLQNGSIDSQEIRLVGMSDDNTLTILDTSLNIKINGVVTLKQYSVLDLCWDETDALWIETGRKE